MDGVNRKLRVFVYRVNSPIIRPSHSIGVFYVFLLFVGLLKG